MGKAAAGQSSVGAGTVVIGTYDGALLGLRGDTGKQIFGYAPHAGCVKAVTCSAAGRLATGGTDHSVRLFDLAKGLELGELQEHDDTVCCLEFWGSTSILTGGVDGQVCVWRCSDWELLLKFRAHKAALSDIAVHPSGRMVASAGKDSSVRLWDLTRGTSAAIVSTEEPCDTLLWSPQGGRLAALSAGSVCLVDMSLGGAVATFRSPEASGLMRVALSAIMFLREGEVLVGDGKGVLRVFTFKVGEPPELTEACRLEDDADRVRVKALARSAGGGEVARGDVLPFVLGTSSGRVELWRFTAPAPSKAPSTEHFSRLRVVNTAVRLTCLAYWQGTAHAASRADEVDEDDEELEEEGEEEEQSEPDEAVESEPEAEGKVDPRLMKRRRQ